MSSYADYAEAAKHYDETRIPVGIEIIVGCLAHAHKPLNELTLLDGGCGTGSYAQTLLKHVRCIEAIDSNREMLAVAAAKLADAKRQGRINFHHASLHDLPLPRESVDAVMVNQVLHHLPDSAEQGWSQLDRVLAEFARVLKAGGVLVINVCSHEQLLRGWWYCDLIPDAIRDMQARHVPLDELERMMDRHGFSCRGRFVPLDGVLQGERYFWGLGPTDEGWRASDSLWALVDEVKLERVQRQLQELDDRGELEQFVMQKDAHRRQIGQVTFMCGLRQ